MQTDFTPEQLSDPVLARANTILRACVHCGFCTATCPSYQVLGDELDSPRGRIYLIKEMLESGRPADARTALHIDRCLSCLACMTTCPSGVDYMHLIDLARVHVEKTYRRPWHDRWLRAVLAWIVPYPGRFRLAMGAAKLARPFRRWVPDARLRAMLDMAAAPIPPVSHHDDPQVFAAEGPARFRVALMTGCAQRALNTDINDATIRLLRRAGCEVTIPPAGCCGALSHHLGREREAHDFAAKMIGNLAGQGFDAVIVNTSGCGTVIKDYKVFMADTPGAAEVAGRAADITEFLARIGLPPVKRLFDLRVAYHAACSLQHGQKITAAPKDMLRAAGFKVVEPADAHLCCGSAGTYNLLQPAISAELRARKVATLEARAPDVIAAGNIGCMMQIGGATRVPVVHTVELLDWATGGPRPPALAGLETVARAPI